MKILKVKSESQLKGGLLKDVLLKRMRIWMRDYYRNED